MTATARPPAMFPAQEPDPALFDLGDWPIVQIRFPELNEADRVVRVLGGLEHLLARKTPFVAVWIPASHDHDDEPHEDEKASNIWIRQHRDTLNTYCRGYVYITADEALRALLTGRIATLSGRLFRFPMAVASTRTEAGRIGRSMLGPAAGGPDI